MEFEHVQRVKSKQDNKDCMSFNLQWNVLPRDASTELQNQKAGRIVVVSKEEDTISIPFGCQLGP